MAPATVGPPAEADPAQHPEIASPAAAHNRSVRAIGEEIIVPVPPCLLTKG